MTADALLTKHLTKLIEREPINADPDTCRRCHSTPTEFILLPLLSCGQAETIILRRWDDYAPLRQEQPALWLCTDCYQVMNPKRAAALRYTMDHYAEYLTRTAPEYARKMKAAST